jgi:hypothetical protein
MDACLFVSFSPACHRSFISLKVNGKIGFQWIGLDII